MTNFQDQPFFQPAPANCGARLGSDPTLLNICQCLSHTLAVLRSLPHHTAASSNIADVCALRSTPLCLGSFPFYAQSSATGWGTTASLLAAEALGVPSFPRVCSPHWREAKRAIKFTSRSHCGPPQLVAARKDRALHRLSTPRFAPNVFLVLPEWTSKRSPTVHNEFGFTSVITSVSSVLARPRPAAIGPGTSSPSRKDCDH